MDAEKQSEKPQGISSSETSQQIQRPEVASEMKKNEPNENLEKINKIRQKMLPRSVSSAADLTNTKYNKLRWQNDNKRNGNAGKPVQDSKNPMLPETKHIPMKLRRKSELVNYKMDTKWAQRPTDMDASETDIILLRRWIDNTRFYSMEENPIKSFRLKDEEIYDLENESIAIKNTENKSAFKPPILISTPIDPYSHLHDDEIQSFSGDCDEHGKPEGKNVVISFKNGDIFRGGVNNGEKCGYGILKFGRKKKLTK